VCGLNRRCDVCMVVTNVFVCHWIGLPVFAMCVRVCTCDVFSVCCVVHLISIW